MVRGTLALLSTTSARFVKLMTKNRSSTFVISLFSLKNSDWKIGNHYRPSLYKMTLRMTFFSHGSHSSGSYRIGEFRAGWPRSIPEGSTFWSVEVSEVYLRCSSPTSLYAQRLWRITNTGNANEKEQGRPKAILKRSRSNWAFGLGGYQMEDHTWSFQHRPIWYYIALLLCALHCTLYVSSG